jgi:tetratricopeptide (TPR) repeat protein
MVNLWTSNGFDFLRNFEFDSAIAVFNSIIDHADGNNYLGRGIAQCFSSVEKGKIHAEAISDLSTARSLDSDNIEALYYRAYAYYMDKRYDLSIADCMKMIDLVSKNKNMIKPEIQKTSCLYELLGNIYFEQKRYADSLDNYHEAIKVLLSGNGIISSSLFDKYRKVTEKMRDEE